LADREKLKCQIKVGNRYLELACVIKSSVQWLNPLDMLTGIATSLFVPNYAHKANDLLKVIDRYCCYITPCFNPLVIQSKDIIEVMAITINEGLHCFALMSGIPVVIRPSVCL